MPPSTLTTHCKSELNRHKWSKRYFWYDHPCWNRYSPLAPLPRCMPSVKCRDVCFSLRVYEVFFSLETETKRNTEPVSSTAGFSPSDLTVEGFRTNLSIVSFCKEKRRKKKEMHKNFLEEVQAVLLNYSWMTVDVNKKPVLETGLYLRLCNMRVKHDIRQRSFWPLLRFGAFAFLRPSLCRLQ